jgi:hypothetical protein
MEESAAGLTPRLNNNGCPDRSCEGWARWPFSNQLMAELVKRKIENFFVVSDALLEHNSNGLTTYMINFKSNR